jgi:hypothetical protein
MVLKAAGVGSLGFGGLTNATVTVGATERNTRIGFLAEGHEVVRKVKVPKRWKQQAEQARRAKRQVSNALSGRSDIHTIGIGNQDSRIDGLRKHTVDVQVDPDGELSGIPGEVNGIPVVAEKSGRPQETCYTQDKDKIYGGLSSDGPKSDHRQGTLCCRVFKNGSKYLLGCRHIFTHRSDMKDYCVNDNPTGEKWERAGSTAGEIAEAYKRHDAVLLDTQHTSKSISKDIVDDGGTMTGRVTESGLNYLQSSDEQVEKRGIETCISGGTVTKIQQELYCGNYNYVGGVVRSTTEQKSGDSGGPVYYKESDSLYLVNIATARKSSSNSDAQGSSANDIFNDQNVTFGGDPYSG